MIFAFDILLTFFVEYINEEIIEEPPIRDLKMIAYKYATGKLILHLIPTIPLQLINISDSGITLFYLIKLIRIERGLSLLNV